MCVVLEFISPAVDLVFLMRGKTVAPRNLSPPAEASFCDKYKNLQSKRGRHRTLCYIQYGGER